MSNTNGVHLRRDLVDQYGEYTVRTALRDGLLEQPWRGVIVNRTRSNDLDARAAAGLLAVGPPGVLAGPTAAALHGCAAAADTPDIHVAVPDRRSVRKRRGLVVHNLPFEPADVVTRMDLPVLALDLVVAEMLCTAPRQLALACADQALAALPPPQRDEFRAEVDNRLVVREDRRGTVRGEVLLTLATGLAESPPESLLRLIVVDAGFPIPEPQVEVCDLEGRVVYRLDLAWQEVRIALEYDGYEAHEDRAEADAERDRRLAGRGWIVIRVRAADLRRPERVLAELHGAFGARGRPVRLRERAS